MSVLYLQLTQERKAAQCSNLVHSRTVIWYHYKSNCACYFYISRSKVKVTRSHKAVANAPSLTNGWLSR